MATDPRRRQSRADSRVNDTGGPDGIDRRKIESPRVKIDVLNEDRGLVIVLCNPLIVDNCFPVRDALAAILHKFSTQTLFVDIAGVPYADTAGLGMLVAMRKVWNQQQRELVVRNPSPRVARILRVLQMDRNLVIEKA